MRIMKTQINGVLSGAKDVAFRENDEYITFKEERIEIGSDVLAENGEKLRISIMDKTFRLNLEKDEENNEWSYVCEISDDDARVFLSSLLSPNINWNLLILDMQLNCTVVNYHKRNEDSDFKFGCKQLISNEIITIME